MRRILHGFWLALALTAALMMLAPQALAAENESTVADYITVDADGTVTLHSTHMAAEGVSSLQLTLNGTESFTLAGGLDGRLTYVRAGSGSVTVYIAGTTPLMDSSGSLVLGSVPPGAEVKLANQSLKYVYGSSAMAQNFEDEQEPSGGVGMTPEEAEEALSAGIERAEAMASEEEQYTAESWAAFQDALRLARDVLDRRPDAGEMVDALRKLEEAQNALTDKSSQEPEVERGGSGGTIYDGYDDGTSPGASEPTLTPDPTAAPSPEPSASAAPYQTPAATGGPVSTSEPLTTNVPAAPAAPTQAPVVQAGGAGPQAPATGDETVFTPWALMLCICGALLAVVLVRGKRRQ